MIETVFLFLVCCWRNENPYTFELVNIFATFLIRNTLMPICVRCVMQAYVYLFAMHAVGYNIARTNELMTTFSHSYTTDNSKHTATIGIWAQYQNTSTHKCTVNDRIHVHLGTSRTIQSRNIFTEIDSLSLSPTWHFPTPKLRSKKKKFKKLFFSCLLVSTHKIV